MESNIDVSPQQASQALAAVEADQEAIRTAAQPPKWYILGLSVCIGVVVVISGILPPRFTTFSPGGLMFALEQRSPC